ncbi:MAG: hypothetical protein JNL96_17510 [Planctomycetaceae bacterium]|nr:hypothetical protein [Planctomycetaceae bacterium]
MNESPKNPDDSADARDAPPTLQYSLRALLTVVFLISALFALAARADLLWGAVLVWTALLVAAHMAASAVGTQATQRAMRRRQAETSPGGRPIDAGAANAPTTRLGGNDALGLGMALVVLAGGIVGSIVGTCLIWRHNDGLDWGGLTLAGAASAVIGGFLTFLCGTFTNAAARAMREAARHASRR